MVVWAVIQIWPICLNLTAAMRSMPNLPPSCPWKRRTSDVRPVEREVWQMVDYRARGNRRPGHRLVVYLHLAFPKVRCEAGKHLDSPEAMADCYECHLKATPKVAQDWYESKHGIQLVKCFMCHGQPDGKGALPFAAKPAANGHLPCAATIPASSRCRRNSGWNRTARNAIHSIRTPSIMRPTSSRRRKRPWIERTAKPVSTLEEGDHEHYPTGISEIYRRRFGAHGPWRSADRLPPQAQESAPAAWISG